MKKLGVIIFVLIGLLGVTTVAYGIHHSMWTHGNSLQIETPNKYDDDKKIAAFEGLSYSGDVGTSFGNRDEIDWL